MAEGAELVRWARRVPLGAIRRLYRSYAEGRVEEELLEEVAFGLYARCQSILAVKAAKEGRVACPSCQATVVRAGRGDQPIRCASCGWETTWFAYRKTFLRRQLNHGGAADVFEGYLKRLPRARSVDEKMGAVDWLLHECHKMMDPRDGEAFWARPVVPNLLRGTLAECMELLDELAYGMGVSEDAAKRQREWRARVRAESGRLREIVDAGHAARRQAREVRRRDQDRRN